MKIVREHINEKFSEDSDPVHDMGIGLEGKMREELKNYTVMDLINFLDEIPKIRKKYRNEEAEYDDTYYEDVPLKTLDKLGIKPYMLELISDNTDNYDGWLNVHGEDTVSMGGGD